MRISRFGSSVLNTNQWTAVKYQQTNFHQFSFSESFLEESENVSDFVCSLSVFPSNIHEVEVSQLHLRKLFHKVGTLHQLFGAVTNSYYIAYTFFFFCFVLLHSGHSLICNTKYKFCAWCFMVHMCCCPFLFSLPRRITAVDY